MKNIISVFLMLVVYIIVLTCSGCSVSSNSSSSSASAQDQVSKDPVLFYSGGTIDDNVATILLSTFEGIDYLGIVITNTDCVYSCAMQNQWKIQSFLNNTSLQVTLSDARGFNPFPWQYRGDCYDVYSSSVLKDYKDNSKWPPYPSGETLLRDLLSQAVNSGRTITLLITEPLTSLSNVLKENRSLEKGIKRVIWMGGAINVKGNLDPKTIPPEIANDKAEWNAFWDPYAVDWIFKNTSFQIIMFPLDVTDQAPLSQDFMASLKAQSMQYSYSNLVYSIYSLVNNEPYFEMWNTLTTVYVSRPDLFQTPVSMNLVIETEGYWQGAITQDSKGRQVNVVLNPNNIQNFYSYVLNQLKR